MAWPNEWTDEEFDGRVAKLDALLDELLGHPPERTDDLLDADFVMMPLWLPAAGLGAMNPRQERDKLRKVRHLAKELAKAWASLHSDTRSKMTLLSPSAAEGKYATYRSRDRLSLGVVSVLDGLIGTAAPMADEVIGAAPIAGRRDLVNVAIVERLRMVWFQRKKVVAPKSMTEAGPFADFMFAVFEVLGLPGNPRAAVDSWRKFRAKYPLSD